jgi:hypothetical protein
LERNGLGYLQGERLRWGRTSGDVGIDLPNSL